MLCPLKKSRKLRCRKARNSGRRPVAASAGRFIFLDRDTSWPARRGERCPKLLTWITQSTEIWAGSEIHPYRLVCLKRGRRPRSAARSAFERKIRAPCDLKNSRNSGVKNDEP